MQSIFFPFFRCFLSIKVTCQVYYFLKIFQIFSAVSMTVLCLIAGGLDINVDALK